jgi:2-polyprenyl-3-methyl-5-hydroxy-6-metoxy-1,4-benzoquinol methylase
MMEKVKDSAEHLAAHYDQISEIQSDFRNYNLVQLIASFVHGKRILEIGSGSGHLLHALALRGCDVVGLEPNAHIAASSQNKYPDIRVINSTLEEIEKHITGSFDNIVMVDVLEHIVDDANAIRLLSRFLAPNGVLLIAVPAYPWLFGSRDTFAGHYRRYTKEMIKKLFLDNHFSIIRMRQWNMLGVLPYAISEKIFNKPLNSAARLTRRGFIHKLFNSVLHAWFATIERYCNIGFGLTLICTARVTKK